MLKNKLKLSIAAAILCSSYLQAGTVTAPNSLNIELSGDVELKQIREKSKTETINYRTAEINLNLDSKMDNGLEFHYSAKAYNDTQASSTADTGVDTTHGYAVVPFLEGKGKIIAGLVPNFPYGTDAFEEGGESWKIAVFAPIMKGIKVGLISKIEDENEADKNTGDDGSTALRVDGTFDNIAFGLKYAEAYINKNDGWTGVAATNEKEIEVMTGYVTGDVVGINYGAEYITKDITNVGGTTAQQPKANQKGYYLEANKDIVENLNIGLAYAKLQNGLVGGEDFAVSLVLDGNIDSSTTKDTSAFVIPVSYKITDNLSINATYVDAKIEDISANEYDIGIEYIYNDNVTLSATYGDFDADTNSPIEGTKNLELSLVMRF